MSPGSDPGLPDMAACDFVFGVSPFYFVRHGETHETRNGIVQGQLETQLTLAGRQSAEALARSLNGREIGAIYSSPLERALMTASIIAEQTGAPIHLLDGLKERYWGKYQGRPKGERPATPNPESAEPLDDFSARVMAAMHSISGAGPVMVVAHSGVFRVLLRQMDRPVCPNSELANARLVLIEPPKNRHDPWDVRELVL